MGIAFADRARHDRAGPAAESDRKGEDEHNHRPAHRNRCQIERLGMPLVEFRDEVRVGHIERHAREHTDDHWHGQQEQFASLVAFSELRFQLHDV